MRQKNDTAATTANRAERICVVLSPTVVAALRRQARRHERSVSGETRVLLTEALGLDQGDGAA